MKFRALLLSTASYLALASISHAADMRVKPVYKAPPPPAAVAANWTGWYVGGHVGFASLRSRQTSTLTPGSQNTALEDLCDPAFADAPGPCHFRATSAVVGGQIGYNWQVQ